MFREIVDKERKIQLHLFIAENHLQVDVRSDIWKIYKRYGDTLRLNTINFSLVNCHSLRYELKYFHKYMFERTGKINSALFASQQIALNILT